MAKKKSAPKTKHISVSPTHLMIRRSIVSYAIAVFLVFAMAAMSWYLLDRLAQANVNQNRLNNITSIYTSLSLGDSYRGATSNLFGDKRVYSWDNGRTYSSSIEYGHNDTVSNTFADLKKKIESAGFKYFETDYANSVSQQYHFKNDKNEYVRVSVVTKAWQDMLTYGALSAEDWQNVDKNAAPSYVTIKVNLDDNNE